ncbi:hypothetical protein F7734_06085 [Scytonema sp. UIC 10036]|uniref:hypothetical protein n=1 Tax=Scytonema sp. UIC 10036 TaxID=2304196 RepID=UPI0012DA9BAA|nr:hypothetical protein [Scytonema sp. UIC 10036]MUG92052.1 hypothetical protein [Scytonema sp. UIC 10036]
MDITEKLASVVRNLNIVQVGLLLEMAQAMTVKIEEFVNEGSDLLTPEFVTNFSNRLIIHHATHVEKFSKKSFEYAFASASTSAGRNASITLNSTNPGEDVIVDGVKFSLKTEASAGLIPKKSITISKLMEARWIRECKVSTDFARETTYRVVSHLRNYDRIVMLRAYDILPPLLKENQTETVPVIRDSDAIQTLPKVRYDLYEIPLNILMLIQGLKESNFKPRTKNGGSSAKVYTEDNKAAFTLILDGSVEKITIGNLGIDLCFLHGSWVIPTIEVNRAKNQSNGD